MWIPILVRQHLYIEMTTAGNFFSFILQVAPWWGPLLSLLSSSWYFAWHGCQSNRASSPILYTTWRKKSTRPVISLKIMSKIRLRTTWTIWRIRLKRKGEISAKNLWIMWSRVWGRREGAHWLDWQDLCWMHSLGTKTGTLTQWMMTPEIPRGHYRVRLPVICIIIIWSLYKYMDYHCNDKMFVRSSYPVHDENSDMDKIAYLYWHNLILI